MLTDPTVERGICTWCRNETDVIVVEFSGPPSIIMTLCQKHLWEAATNRSGLKKQKRMKGNKPSQETTKKKTEDES